MLSFKIPSMRSMFIGSLATLVVFALLGITDFSQDDANSNTIDQQFSPLFGYFRSYSRHFQRSHNESRSTRNADPLTEYSHKLSSVARIANGISLVNGLIDGKIPIDAVIEELFNFGSAKISDVLGIQKDKIDAVLQELEAVSGKLDKSNGVEDLEAQTIGLIRIGEEYKTIGNFPAFVAPDEYFNAVQSLNDSLDDFKIFKVTSDQIKAVLYEIEEVKKPNIKTNTLSAKSRIENIKKYLESMKQSSLVEISTLAPKISSLVVEVNEAPLNPLIVMTSLLASRRSMAYVGVAGSAELTSNLELTSTLSANFTNIEPDVIALRNMASSQIHRAPTKRAFTTAFPGGAADLKKLESDVRDPSLGQTVGAGKNFGKLFEGLKQLLTLSTKLESVDGKLESIASPEILSSVNLAVKLQQLAAGSSVSSSDASDVFSALASCKVPTVSASSKVETLVKGAKDLPITLSRMKSIAEIISSSSQNSDVLQKFTELFSSFPASDASDNDLNGVLNELNTQSDLVQKAVADLERIKKVLEEINSFNLESMAYNITRHKDTIEVFQQDLFLIEAIDRINCLNNRTEPVEIVRKAIEASRIIRNLKPHDIENMKQAINTIFEASGPIMELQALPASMKSGQAEDVKKMAGMKDSKETAEVLGTAAGSIYFMEALRGMESTIDFLRNENGAVFNAEIGKVTDANQRLEIGNKWGDHTSFLVSLSDTLQQIKDFASKLPKDQKFDNLRHLGDPLDTAKLVTGVTASIVDKSDAISTLIAISKDPTAQKALSDTQAQLNSLASLDLGFAAHHASYAEVNGSLKALFEFLSSFLAAPTAVIQTVGHSRVDSEGTSIPLMAILILLCLIVVVVLLGCGGRRYYKVKRNAWKKVVEILVKLKYHNEDATLARQETLVNNMYYEGESQDRLDPKFYKDVRYNLGINEKQRVKLKGGAFYHASWIVCKDAGFFRSIRFIAAQAPIYSNEKKAKEDNRKVFWQMIIEQGCEFVVKLCRDVEKEYLKRQKLSLSFERRKDHETQYAHTMLLRYSTLVD